MKFSDTVTVNQWAHMGWGGLIACEFSRHGHPLIGLVSVIILAAIKEGRDALTVQDNDGAGMDATFFLIGAVIGM